MFFVTAATLKQQISTFYLQILSNKGRFYICDRLLTEINEMVSFCAKNLQVKF